jgi:hypothetical protein
LADPCRAGAIGLAIAREAAMAGHDVIVAKAAPARISDNLLHWPVWNWHFFRRASVFVVQSLSGQSRLCADRPKST